MKTLVNEIEKRIANLEVSLRLNNEAASKDHDMIDFYGGANFRIRAEIDFLKSLLD